MAQRQVAIADRAEQHGPIVTAGRRESRRQPRCSRASLVVSTCNRWAIRLSGGCDMHARKEADFPVFIPQKKLPSARPYIPIRTTHFCQSQRASAILTPEEYGDRYHWVRESKSDPLAVPEQRLRLPGINSVRVGCVLASLPCATIRQGHPVSHSCGSDGR